MTDDQVAQIKPGLYLIYWKEEQGGGASLAAVGCDEEGKKWYHPTNWISGPSFDWEIVERVGLLPYERRSTMPNMFGGDQFHPAYDPDTKLKENQVLVGNDLYTISIEGSGGTFSCESVNGERRAGWINSAPKQVQDKAKELAEKAKKDTKPEKEPNPDKSMEIVIEIRGPAKSGKTTVGALLGQALGNAGLVWSYDDIGSPSAIDARKEITRRLQGLPQYLSTLRLILKDRGLAVRIRETTTHPAPKQNPGKPKPTRQQMEAWYIYWYDDEPDMSSPELYVRLLGEVAKFSDRELLEYLKGKSEEFCERFDVS